MTAEEEDQEEEKSNFSDSNKSQSFSRYTDADKITEITGIAKDNWQNWIRLALMCRFKLAPCCQSLN
jgi:hypothetical protein